MHSCGTKDREARVMLVEQFMTGGDRNYGYLAADEQSKQAVAVDPSYSPEMIVTFAQKHGLQIVYIFNTHGDYDHTNGNSAIEKLTGVHAVRYGDIEKSTGNPVKDGARYPLGNLEISIIHTPGHTNDSMCIYVGDAVFTGDTLFVGKVGGTDFGKQARLEYDSLHQQLLALPDETRVFPGHNYGLAPQSTIGEEKKNNPFLVQPDFDAFVDLKKNWAEYKKQHGIP